MMPELLSLLPDWLAGKPMVLIKTLRSNYVHGKDTDWLIDSNTISLNGTERRRFGKIPGIAKHHILPDILAISYI